MWRTGALLVLGGALGTAHAGDRVTCAEVVAEVERFGARVVEEYLADPRYRVTPSLVRCLESKDLPQSVVDAARARVGVRSGSKVVVVRHELDVTRTSWPREFGQLVAHRALQVDPGSEPAVLNVQLLDLPDWFIPRRDEAAAAVLASLPQGSRALADPNVLGHRARLFDDDRSEACTVLQNMGFRRTFDLQVAADDEGGLTVSLSAWDNATLEQSTGSIAFGEQGEGEASSWVADVRVLANWGTGTVRAGRRFPFRATLLVDDDQLQDFALDGRVGDGEIFGLKRRGGARFMGRPVAPDVVRRGDLLTLRARAGGLVTDWIAYSLPVERVSTPGSPSLHRQLRRARVVDGVVASAAALASAGAGASWWMSGDFRSRAAAISDPRAGDEYDLLMTDARMWSSAGAGLTAGASALVVGVVLHHVFRTGRLRSEVLSGAW